MAAGNEVTLVGNITSDIDLKITPSGTAVARFGLAWNRKFQKDGEWQEEPNFFDVTVWREQAEHLAESAGKGSRVIVIGRLEQQRWEDKETGAGRSKVAVAADEVGVSLRWATAEVTKAEREGGQQYREERPAAGGRGGREAAPRRSERPEPGLAGDDDYF
jgi:single-strand DNA-binding protein